MYLADSLTAASMALSVIFTEWWASYLSLMPFSISMDSSSVGSPTVMGWNLLSRAASFSICFRYSSSVVAPITCISPLARSGFKMLAASMAPSAAPAPTMVCISSMNRITFPALRISSMDFFRRSSNSPLYLAPATMDERSKVTTRLSFSISGTLPSTIFWARPSQMAVLPTPGSPIRQGLFLVRRLRIWITLSISLSLPMIGSTFPSLAMAVRSRPNWSRVGVSTSMALGLLAATAAGVSSASMEIMLS